MQHKYDIRKLLLSTLAYKGAIYPGIFSGSLDKNVLAFPALDYDKMPETFTTKYFTDGGTPIRKSNYLGRYYFMPVYISSANIDFATPDEHIGTTKKIGFEIPHAVISITGKKTIVETPLTGRSGTVKELISTDDYEISITGVIESNDRINYPEAEVAMMKQLFEMNQSVELISALSDIVLGNNTKIVLKSCNFPVSGAVEYAQVVEFTAVSDQPFELEIK